MGHVDNPEETVGFGRAAVPLSAGNDAGGGERKMFPTAAVSTFGSGIQMGLLDSLRICD